MRADADDLLRANEAFYDAFATRDIEAMDELWARGVPVVCVHPGWPALEGREEVMSSWREILLGGSSPDVSCESPRASIYGDVGLVVCIERIDDSALVATNVFLAQSGVWQLVHHQGGPLAAAADTGPPDRTLN
jgi:limonene-1,2-epoxide hydrolase